MQKASLKVKDFLVQTPLIAAFSDKAMALWASKSFCGQHLSGKVAVNANCPSSPSQRL
jgi:hypothetical protein